MVVYYDEFWGISDGGCEFKFIANVCPKHFVSRSLMVFDSWAHLIKGIRLRQRAYELVVAHLRSRPSEVIAWKLLANRCPQDSRSSRSPSSIIIVK